MNSADKSVAPIDGALRRRFKFIEILPDSKKLKDNLEDINLQKLLEAINIRIEYLYNREHTIGHSYFMNINNLNDLKEVFKNNIIPLLAEYFYEDWEKIKLILNDNKDKFIVELKDVNNYLKNIQDSFEDKKLYKVGDIDKLEISDFKNIHE
jgi:5-methylcytosine-specific restriction protein B